MGKLDNVINGIAAVEALLPFVLGLVRIIKRHAELGHDSVPLSEIQDLWQTTIDRTDSKFRGWLEEHGIEAPPPKPDAVEEE